MTLLLVVLVGFTLTAFGFAVGYGLGRQDGAEDAYRAVEKHYRHKS